MMVAIEAGTLNSSTGAEEASDSVVRFDSGAAVVAGHFYEFVYSVEGSTPKLFFYDTDGDFISKIDAATGEAPADAVTCRAIIDTSGVTEFGFEFREVPEYDIDASISLSGNPADLTWYMGDGTVITGFEAQHDYESSTVKSLAIYARIKDWQGLTALDLSACDLVGSCNMSALDVFEQAEIDLSGNPLLTGLQFAPIVSGQLLTLDLSGCNVSAINWDALYNCLQIANCEIDLSDNGLSEAQVDYHLAALDMITDSGYSGRVISIDGTNAAPSADGEASVSNLEDKGFTVNVTSA